MTTQRKIAVATLMSLTLLSGRFLFAQDSAQQSPSAQKSMDQDIDLLRKDVRSQKKQMIAANMHLTDQEAEKFWPVYDQYTNDLVTINNKKYEALKQYAQNYDTLSDDQAKELTQQVLEVDASVAQLRQKYIPIFNKVVSGKKTALFFQLDRRLVMLIDIQLSAAVPLVQPQ
jgi:Zn-dependent M32 family carboxypeptidase